MSSWAPSTLDAGNRVPTPVEESWDIRVEERFERLLIAGREWSASHIFAIASESNSARTPTTRSALSVGSVFS
jgi:hypothetical protein